MAEETLAELSAFLHNVEFVHLQQKHVLDTLQEKVTALELVASSLETDRDHVKSRLAAVEKAPADTQKHLEAVEKRLTVVEGAVGSTGFKHTKHK